MYNIVVTLKNGDKYEFDGEYVAAKRAESIEVPGTYHYKEQLNSALLYNHPALIRFFKFRMSPKDFPKSKIKKVLTAPEMSVFDSDNWDLDEIGTVKLDV